MKNKIKTGVVGVGHLGQHHTKHYTKIKSAELVGVYDINEAQAKKIAKQFKTKAFSSLDEMLESVEKTVYSDSRTNELFSLGKQQIKKYSWQKCASETLSIYQSII